MSKIVIAAAAVGLIGGTMASHSTPVGRVLRAGGRADSSASFAWSGAVASGHWLRVRDLAGSVEVRRATGSNVEIHATREPRRWDWGSTVVPVRFVVKNDGGDVVVCAVSDDMPRCDSTSLRSDDSNNRSDFWDNHRPEPMRVVVELPAGVEIEAISLHGDLKIENASAQVRGFSGHGDISITKPGGEVSAETGHGDVNIDDAPARVIAHTGHGNMQIERAGNAVSATTGHGNIEVELLASAATGSHDLRFETGHGDIHVVAPNSLHGNVDLRSNHGRVTTSFPLTFDDRRERSGWAHGTLASADRSVRLSTGHGDIELTNTR